MLPETPVQGEAPYNTCSGPVSPGNAVHLNLIVENQKACKQDKGSEKSCM